MSFIKKMENLADKFSNIKDLPLFLMRLALAYGFYKPAVMKWGNIGNVSEWFGSLGIPFPELNAYLAASAEAVGVVLLALGLGTRWISIPLMFVMLVAIFTVHISNGFQAGNNGFEIPLYYFIMLMTLMVFGGGKLSVDYLISTRKQEENLESKEQREEVAAVSS